MNRRISSVKIDRPRHEVVVNRIDLIVAARFSSADCSIKMAIAVGLGRPMTAVDLGGRDREAAGRERTAEAPVHGIVVVDRRPAMSKTTRSISIAPAFLDNSIERSDSPSSRATTCSASPNESVMPAPPTPVIAVTARCRMNDHIRLRLVLDIRSVPP